MIGNFNGSFLSVSGSPVKIFHATGSESFWEENDIPFPLSPTFNNADVTYQSTDHTIRINQDMNVLIYARGYTYLNVKGNVQFVTGEKPIVRVNVNGSDTVLCASYYGGVMEIGHYRYGQHGMCFFQLKKNDVVSLYASRYTDNSDYYRAGYIFYAGIIQLS